MGNKIIENYPNKSGKRALIMIETSIYDESEIYKMCAENQIPEADVLKHNFVVGEITAYGMSIPEGFKGRRYSQTAGKIVEAINKSNGYSEEDVNDLLDSMYMLEDLDTFATTLEPSLLN